VDGGYFGDDYGAQNNLLFSPAGWRRLVKPRLARLFAPFHERGLPVILHSDGQIQKILPDLVEIGLTALNPVQPEVLDHAWLYKNFGGRLSFYGGISIHPDRATQRQSGRGARRGRGLPARPGPRWNRAAPGPLAPHDGGYPDGERGGDAGGVSSLCRLDPKGFENPYNSS